MFGGDEDDSVVRLRVKICGLTSPEDAAAAIEYGADALGFNFFPGSKRYLSIDAGREWIAALPAGTTRVAVLVNPTWAEALAAAELPGISALQLHGAETPAFCRRLAERGIQFAKAVAVTSRVSISKLPSFSTRTVVLDSGRTGRFGGSGRTFPWQIARAFVKANPRLRVILAGGLTPENVAQAVAIVRPFGIDVTTGVESAAGRKDYGRLRAFIAAARAS
jgi:phosphoribosylanthranilate isomerase